MRKKLLLHTCCGPCATYPIEKLKADYDIKCFFFNPNIQPIDEYEERRGELERFLEGGNIEPEWGAYKIEQWRDAIAGMEEEPEGSNRCRKCFEFRLRESAVSAKRNGYKVFSTTLTVSPHKNAAAINEIGKKVAEEYGLDFLAEDFKKNNGFKAAARISAEHKLKRQDYCGCAYSRRKV